MTRSERLARRVLTDVACVVLVAVGVGLGWAVLRTWGG